MDIRILHEDMGVGHSNGSEVAGTGLVGFDPQVVYMGLLDPPRPILYMSLCLMIESSWAGLILLSDLSDSTQFLVGSLG